MSCGQFDIYFSLQMISSALTFLVCGGGKEGDATRTCELIIPGVSGRSMGG